ncbi:MAG: CvpA family protein [Lentisphaerae bacterium]|nr:CvpA family protein [Lentisphaerota bacterium]
MNFAWPPNAVDAGAGVVLLWGMLVGLRRGLSGELGQLAGVVAAFVCGLRLYGPFADWLLTGTRLTGQSARAAAFLITVIAALIVLIVMRAFLRGLVRLVVAETADRPLGLAAGLLRSAVLIVIVVVVMNLWPSATLNRMFGEASVVGTLVLRALPALREDAETGERGADG